MGYIFFLNKFLHFFSDAFNFEDFQTGNNLDMFGIKDLFLIKRIAESYPKVVQSCLCSRSSFKHILWTKFKLCLLPSYLKYLQP